MDINEAVREYMKEGEGTLSVSQSVLVDAYMICVINDENLGYHEIMELTELFEQILNKL